MDIEANGARLFHTVRGSGEPVVLVHGSWGDHQDWSLVAPALAERHTVVAYDRRGHSASAGRPATVHEHVADLAALVDALGLGPVHLVAHSYGASIALRAAALHPDRVRSLAAHEPPLMWILDAGGKHAGALGEFRERCARVEAHLRAGRMREAAEIFVDEIGLGPGAWKRLARSARETFARNAPTFLAELEDPDALALDLASLRAYRGPALLTRGDRSPPLYAPILDRVTAALPQGTLHTFPGAGHVPQVSHPRDWLTRVEAFLASCGGVRP